MASKRYSKEGTMNESAKATIELVIRTLNSVSAAGKNNLDMLLGSILALEKLLSDADKEDTENG